MELYVLDDDINNLQDIVAKIRMSTDLQNGVHGFTNAEELFAYAAENPCDAVFLKIEMRSTSGLKVAEKLIRMHPNVNIIFESASDFYMKSAFDLRCSGYLMLPIRNQDIRGELSNLRYTAV
jgi:two-component system LytT family response regulator